MSNSEAPLRGVPEDTCSKICSENLWEIHMKKFILTPSLQS